MDREIKMIDIRAPQVIEVLVADDIAGGTTVWINTEKGCQLRAEKVQKLIIRDDRELVPRVSSPGEGPAR